MKKLIGTVSLLIMLTMLAEISKVEARQSDDSDMPEWITNPQQKNKDTLFVVVSANSQRFAHARNAATSKASHAIIEKLNKVIVVLNASEIGISKINDIYSASGIHNIDFHTEKDLDGIITFYGYYILELNDVLYSIDTHIKEELEELEYKTYLKSNFRDKIADVLIAD